MSFLVGDGEMAGRIRDFDWANHPFGPAEQWPQSLRSALGICLNSAFPTAIYWGPELRLLYNDAWSVIPGPRHPACLGARAEDVWSDIWHVIEPQFSHLIRTGEGLNVEDQMLPMQRYGYVEETYWSYNFTPIRGEDGAIHGVFNSGSESTSKVLQQRHSQFLLALYEVLRDSTDAEATMAAVCDALGPHFGASRVVLCEVEQGGTLQQSPVSAHWSADPEAAVPDHPSAELETIAHGLEGNAIVRHDDVAAITSEALRKQLERQGAGAFLAVPWVENRVLRHVLTLSLPDPRRWSDEDVSTVEKVLERTIGAIDRAKAAQRERVMAGEIDHRARNLLAVVSALARVNDAPDVDSFREKFLDRVMALSHTHTLLAGNRWTGLSLRRLLHELLAPYNYGAASRVSLEGPRILLEPEIAQYLGMVFHELATNAAKHGALRAKDGSLRIVWTLHDKQRLDIEWCEDGIGVEDGTPRFKGFGSMLLRRIIEQQLAGTISKTFAAGQLSCDISMPFKMVDTTRAEPPAPVGDPGPKRDAVRVLVVEDDPIIALDLSAALTELGYAVVSSARTVESALAFVEESEPQLVLLDLNLAGESSEPVGVALVERDVPFLQITGYEKDVRPDSVFANRPRIIKPYTMSELREQLDELSAPLRQS
ncbi:HWE histidine kinase domain-containing protein [Sulfitobacter sp. D35]|uniref:HWE histidine kinase domain-containing protein n=1 Tax=Sulfitobacter sp. D35 TaxID=3083252 RepID=UPI00296E5886|nr:HWE histidine kinase domain-containing protein [Sulfitobacter sp. D35]MDW4498540.1 HWE histidine kinase domain-containing protein [Sulfitobacter sp. D35]